MVVTWRFFSHKFQRYFDDTLELESHLSANPDDYIIEVAVDTSASGVVPEIPLSTAYYIRTGDQVTDIEELTVSGGNLQINNPSTSGSPTVYVDTNEFESVTEGLQQDVDEKITAPSGAGLDSIAVFDNTNGEFLRGTPAQINEQGQVFLGTTGTFEPGYCLTVRCAAPSGNGLWLKASDDPETVVLHIEDADGSLQLLHMDSYGGLGLGTTTPEYTLDIQNTSVTGTDGVNTAGQYYKSGRRIDSQVQADFTVATDLLPVVAELPINTGTSIQVGTDFTVNANNITIINAGTYRVTWNVCALLGGTTNNRRRNLQAELNRNSGTIVQATRSAGYARQGNNASTCNAGGSYLIQTAGANETVAIRTEDISTQSTAGITFTVVGGYISVERVD